MAMTSQFLDSAVFLKGQKVTIAGEVMGLKTEPFGNGTYAYPEVKIEELRFWTPSPDYLSYRPHYPYWWNVWPYYDFYGDFFWDDFHHGLIWRGGRWEHRENHHGEGEHEGEHHEEHESR